MTRIVQTLMRLVPRANDKGETLNRFANDKSYDRALAAFKADLAERAAKNKRHIPGEWQSRRT